MAAGDLLDNIKTAARTTSLFTRILVGVLVVFYLVSFSEKAYEVLALQPAATIPPQGRLWQLITAPLIEPSLLRLIADICVMAMCDKLFEPLWGQLEFATFFAVVNIISTLLSSASCLLIYAFTGNLKYLFFSVSGMVATPLGMSVAFKQLFPQKSWAGLGVRLESRFLPSVLLLVTVLLVFLQILQPAHLLFALYGVLTSWTYLRFHQTRNGVRGDRSESFAFSDFFPASLQPLVQTIGGKIYKVCIMLRLCPKPGSPEQSLHNTRVSLPGLEDSDAERRRNLALRDLDVRLQQKGETSSKPQQQLSSQQPAKTTDVALDVNPES